MDLDLLVDGDDSDLLVQRRETERVEWLALREHQVNS